MGELQVCESRLDHALTYRVRVSLSCERVAAAHGKVAAVLMLHRS